jgi:RHS repeat-associated protein
MVTDGAGTITESYVSGPLGVRRIDLGPPLNGSGAPTDGIINMPDALGNVAATVSEAGVRTNAYTYDVFGTPNDAIPTNTLTNRYRANDGRPLDTTTGLVLMGARPYDASTGRFLSVDPEEGGSANVYDYANQNPANEADPTGTSPGQAGRDWGIVGAQAWAWYGDEETLVAGNVEAVPKMTRDRAAIVTVTITGPNDYKAVEVLSFGEHTHAHKFDFPVTEAGQYTLTYKFYQRYVGRDTYEPSFIDVDQKKMNISPSSNSTPWLRPTLPGLE